MTILSQYGVEKFGRLKTVMLHRPTHSVRAINPITMGYYLFDAIPDADRYLDEHDQYRNLLQSQGITTFELSDYVRENRTLMDTLASLPYLNDSSLISRHGAIFELFPINLEKSNIRVNAIAPGPIWTPLTPSSFSAERVKNFGADVPMKRAGQPFELAPAYVYLASDDSRYVSGQVIHVNGGTITES